MFQESPHAYEILSDTEKRAAYESLRGRAFEGGGVGQRGARPSARAAIPRSLRYVFVKSSASRACRWRIFEKCSGAAMAQWRPRRFRFAATDLSRSRSRASGAFEKEISFRKNMTWNAATALAPEPGSRRVSVPTCRAPAIPDRAASSLLPRLSDLCRRGDQSRKPCTVCRGEGSSGHRTLNSTSHPSGRRHGVRGSVIRQRRSRDGRRRRGHLYIVLSVKDHELFERQARGSVLRNPIKFTPRPSAAHRGAPLFGKRR